MGRTTLLMFAVLIVGTCLLIWSAQGGCSAEKMRGSSGITTLRVEETPAQIEEEKQFILRRTAPPENPGPLLKSLGIPKNFSELPAELQNSIWQHVWLTIGKEPNLYPKLNKFARSIPRGTILGGVWMRIWQYMLLGEQVPASYVKYDPIILKKYNRMTLDQKAELSSQMANTILIKSASYLDFLCWLGVFHPKSVFNKYYDSNLGVGVGCGDSLPPAGGVSPKFIVQQMLHQQ